MVNKWELGQLYAFNNNGDVSSFFYELDWLKKVYRCRSKMIFMLLERPDLQNIPRGLQSRPWSRPWGNWGKILLSNGEIFWAKLERHECSVVTKKWLIKRELIDELG